MSRFEPEVDDQPSVARCLMDAGLVLIGGVGLAVLMYFALIAGAIILGVAATIILGRLTARMMP